MDGDNFDDEIFVKFRSFYNSSTKIESLSYLSVTHGELFSDSSELKGQ